MSPSTATTSLIGVALLSPAAAALYAVPLSQSLHLPTLSPFGHHLHAGHQLLDWAAPASVFDALLRRPLDLHHSYLSRMLSQLEDTMPRWAASDKNGGYEMTIRSSPGLVTEEIHAVLLPDGQSLVLSTPRRRVEVSLPFAVRSASSLSLEHNSSRGKLTLRLAKEKPPAAVPIPVTALASEVATAGASTAGASTAEASTAEASTAEASTAKLAAAEPEVSALRERAKTAKHEEEQLNDKFLSPTAEAPTVEAPSGEVENIDAAGQAESESGSDEDGSLAAE